MCELIRVRAEVSAIAPSTTKTIIATTPAIIQLRYCIASHLPRKETWEARPETTQEGHRRQR